MSGRPGLYVHVPFCSRICPYCDFAVLADDEARRRSYTEHLSRELQRRSELGPFDTIYFGGGTPSLLAAEAVERILDTAPLTEDCRRFLEANPEDVNEKTVADWQRLGIDTLSLGVQAFDDGSLDFLGRRHRGGDAERAVELARDGGIGTVSVDLIFGLPGQTKDDWSRELREAIRTEPDHLSCYQLTIHDETLFGRRVREGALIPASVDMQAELFFETYRVLEGAGYVGYEISNFAKATEFRSRHNEKYWDHTPYLGVGPSAHSFDGSVRRWNARTFQDWLRRMERDLDPVVGRERLRDEDLVLESIVLRLRMRDGLDTARFRERFGFDLVHFNEPLIEKLCDEGLLLVSDGHLRPTLAGMAVADSLAVSFEYPRERCQTPRP